ncbi:MAG: Tyrosine recombinase XerS [Firmicutes bacterium ADurb.Bin182]|nr:MAG: Tyrosine recombinase XerS [Firmicutes bacterium ADurb.Bin182]
MKECYDSEKKKKYTQKLREIQKELPEFCGEFFRGIENNTSILTRFGYAVDLRTFFTYLINEVDLFSGCEIRNIKLSDLDKITVTQLEIFLEYLTLYMKEDKEIINQERAKARKLSTLRSFYKYFIKKGKLSSNAPQLIDLPKLHQKSIIRLEPNEVADLLDTAEDGKGLSETQKKYNKLTRKRDVAILTLFLGTGIRISELVGLDMDDINFMSNEFLITRKGGNQDTLVFGEETRKALLDYFLERETIRPEPGHENALFLSLQRKRIGARSVENLVKKYSSLAVPLKKISPHKLRSTYGTMLYRETGDIYLVADILGHKDVNTTKKHYAAISEDRRKIAANVIKLREDD